MAEHNVVVPSDSKELYIFLLTERIKETEANIEALAASKQTLVMQLSRLQSDITLPDDIDLYDKNETRINKTVFVLERENKALTAGEIVTILGERYEPEMVKDAANKQTETNRFSATLTQYSKKPDSLIKYDTVVKGPKPITLFGLNEWFENGQLKKEFTK